MHKFKKILLALAIGAIIVNPVLVFAQTTSQPSTSNIPSYVNHGAEASISNYLCTPSNPADGHDLEYCINKLYRFGISFGAIALVFFLIFAGYLYIVGGETGKSKAKGILQNALIGIGLLVGSYLILSFINPSLVIFKPIQPPVFNADNLPTCEDLGWGENCTIMDTTPGSDSDTSVKYTGSYKACGRTMTDVDAERKQLVNVVVKVWRSDGSTKDMSMSLHPCVAEATKKAFANLYALNPHFPIDTLADAGPTARPIWNKSGTLSPHSFGIAIDVNAWNNCHAFANGTCQPRTDHEWSYTPCPAKGCSPFSVTAREVKAFTDAGFGWGGNWHSSKDYMHFSCAESEGGHCTSAANSTTKTVTPIDPKTVADNLGDDGDIMNDGINYEKDYCDITKPTSTVTALNDEQKDEKFTGLGDFILNHAQAQQSDGSCRGYVDRSQCNKTYKSNAEVWKDLASIDFKENTFYANYSWDGYLAGTGIYYKDRSFSINLHKCVAYQAYKAFLEYYAYTNELIKTARHLIKPINVVGGQIWRNNSDGAISTHSYGLAIDIDSNENGNYKKGYGTTSNWTYSEKGKWVLHAGGAWLPCHTPAPRGDYYLISYNGTRRTLVSDINHQGDNCNPYSISPNDHLVTIFSKYGFGWGGRWEGNNGRGHLDFMHFGSYTGEYGNLYGPQ